MRTHPCAFWIDHDYDRDYAGDGVSRYGAYLYSRAHQFREDGEPITDPVTFATTAFTIASSPIMAPGYVHRHPRIRHVSWCWDDDYRAAFEVQLVAPLPDPIAAVLRRDSHTWADWHRPWHGEAWFEPYDNDRPGAFTVVTVRVPINPAALPAPAYDAAGTPDRATAQAAVAAVCTQLNTTLADILAALT